MTYPGTKLDAVTSNETTCLLTRMKMTMNQSSELKMQRSIPKAVGFICAVLSSVLAFACGGYGGSGDREVFSTNEDKGATDYKFDGHSRYSIKVYVPDEDGKYELVELSPQNAAYARQQAEAKKSKASESATSSMGDGDGSEGISSAPGDGDSEVRQKGQKLEIDEENSIGNFSSEPSIHQLAAWAYDACGVEWAESQLSPAEGIRWPVGAGGVVDGDFHRPSGSSEKWMQAETSSYAIRAWYVGYVQEWGTGAGVRGPHEADDVLRSCDSVIAMQSQLLCTAGKLVEVANGFTPVELRLSTGEESERKVIVPAQAAEDRFLVRRLALETLAAFGQTGDRAVRREGSLQQNCASAMSYAYKNPRNASDEITHTGRRWLFDEFDSVPFRGFHNTLNGTAEHMLSDLNPRMDLYLAQYRRASELLDTLLDEIAYRGISQASALQAEKGIAAAWGLPSESDVGLEDQLETLPNSLRGLAATLLGRLELDMVPSRSATATLNFSGPFDYTPQQAVACQGAVSLKNFRDEDGLEQDIFDLDGSFIKAAVADVPPKSLAQQRARAIVERLGIVLTEDTIVSGSIVALMKEQMALVDAYNAGLGDGNPEASSDFANFVAERSPLYDNQLEGLAEEDFVYALRANLALYSQLNSGRLTTFPPTSIGTGAGLTDVDVLVGDILTGLGSASEHGVITMGLPAEEGEFRFSGMSRAALSQAGYARYAGAAAATHCAGDHTFSADVRSNYADVASLAMNLYRRASQLVELQTSSERNTHPKREALDRLSVSYFSKHSIRGISEVHVNPVYVGERIPGFRLMLAGSPSIAGRSLLDLPIAVVFGEPWIAQCAAGLRTNCDSAVVQAAHLTLVEDSENLEQDYYAGGERLQVDYGFPIDTTVPDDIAYVVLKPEGDIPGEILTAVRQTGDPEVRGVSHFVRDELEKVFSRSSSIGGTDKCLEANFDGVVEQSCLKGIIKNQYVPVANELTGAGAGGDESWKHYLALARESAAKADELGRQLISEGLSRDLRNEARAVAGAEALAEICGGDIKVGSLSLDGLTVSSDEDSQLNACMNPPTAPVVFFQGYDVSGGDRLTALTNQHTTCGDCETGDACTGASTDEPDCCSSCEILQMQAVGLGMEAPPAAAKPPGIAGCSEFMGEDRTGALSAAPVASFFARQFASDNPQVEGIDGDDTSWFAKAITRAQFSEAAMAAALSKLSYREVFDSGTWGLFLNGAIPFLGGEFMPAGTQGQLISLSEEEFTAGPYSAYPLCLRVTVQRGTDVSSPGDECSDFALRIAATLGHSLNDEGELVDAPPAADEVARREERMRQIVEAALWGMARATGTLPANTFNMILPIKNFAVDVEPKQVGWPLLYAKSRFEPADGQYYSLSSDAGTFPSDSSFLNLVRLAPDWLPSTGLRSQVYSNGSVGLSSFLAVSAGNGERFMGLMPSPNIATESITTVQFLQHALKRDNSNYWRIVTDPLDNGNTPKGVELYRDGELYGVMLRRDCRKNKRENEDITIQDTYGDLFPWQTDKDGWNSVLWRYNTSKCDDTDADPGSNQFPTEALLNLSSFSQYGNCSGTPGNVSCTSGEINFWSENKRCDKYYEQYTSCSESGAWFFTPLASPTIWPPSERVHNFIDPGNNEHAMLVGMGLLSCIAEGSGSSRKSAAVPQISDPAQVPMLSRWIDVQAEDFGRLQARMFMENVPQEVVNYYNETGLNGSVGGGQSSDQMLAMAQALEGVYSGFGAVYSGVRAMGDAVRNAEIAMTSAELRRDGDKSRLAVQRLNTIGQIVGSTLRAGAALGSTGVDGFILGRGVGSALNAAAYASDAAFAAASLPEIAKQNENVEKTYDNSIDGVIQSMTEGVQGGYQQALDGMTRVRSSRLDLLRAQNSLNGLQDRAQFAAANSTGADLADLDGDGVMDEIPVNIVYRRNYDITKLRHSRALESAKRYAYLARLSLEQRLGVRLESLDQDIGPLPSPASWMDEVCTVSGIDYAALRTLEGDDQSESEEDNIETFANQYIGDYVDKLEEFVEYYNIEYPFHEDDDAAVLSMRDDLIYGNGMCRREAKNLLYYSDALAGRNDDGDENTTDMRSLEGWRITPCDAHESGPTIQTQPAEGGGVEDVEVMTTTGRCLKVRDQVERLATDAASFSLEDPGLPVLPYAVPTGTSTEVGYLQSPSLALGLSLVTFEAMHQETSPVPDPNDEVDEFIEQQETDYPVPKNAIYQTLEMEKGAYYRLSWVAQTRDLVGAPLDSGKAPYRVMVVDESWKPIFSEEFKAGESADGWGDRTYREVYAPNDGYYHVVFVPLMKEVLQSGQTAEEAVRDGEETSVEGLALSAVQLEYFQPEGPVDYEATGGTRMITKLDCGAGNGQLFRDSFVRRCYQGECYYELTKPIQLTDNDIDGGRWDLPGIAEENYNYRHSTVALNVVGTGVLDCDGANPGCFSNGFVEYDLVHTAYNTALRDYGEEARCFNFGEGEIRRAKALATERYIGIPMSSADEGLIGGADFTKQAFSGRPLTGVYTLRIHESPQMRWENVEDIQLLLNYRYWSRVQRNPN